MHEYTFKRTLADYLAVLLAIFFVVGCGSQGPAGSPGNPGPTGPSGSDTSQVTTFDKRIACSAATNAFPALGNITFEYNIKRYSDASVEVYCQVSFVNGGVIAANNSIYAPTDSNAPTAECDLKMGSGKLWVLSSTSNDQVIAGWFNSGGGLYFLENINHSGTSGSCTLLR